MTYSLLLTTSSVGITDFLFYGQFEREMYSGYSLSNGVEEPSNEAS